MTTTERIPTQVWVDTSPSVIERAKSIAKEKHMTFRGYIAQIVENAVKEESEGKLHEGVSSD